MNPSDPQPTPHPTSRRQFFTRGAQAAALFTVGGQIPTLSAAMPTGSGPAPKGRAIKVAANKVRDITTGPEDRIYIAADQSIHTFDPSGAFLETISLDASPHSLAVHSDGRLFVAFKDHIQILTSNGTPETAWPRLGGDSSLTSIALDPGGNIFVSDSGNHVIWKIDDSGQVLDKIDNQGRGFAVPKDFFPIAVTPRGQLSAVNVGRHRIDTFDPEGKTISSWGEKSRDLEGFGGCCNPVALALTSTGHAVTAEAGLPRIKIFNADGTFHALVAGPDTFETNARESRERPEQPAACHTGGFEIAVDSKNRILVLDRVAAEFHIFA
jgi:DNA-binding beta-propeller fold protein YncE